MSLFTIIPDRGWQDFSYSKKFVDSLEEIQTIFLTFYNFWITLYQYIFNIMEQLNLIDKTLKKIFRIIKNYEIQTF